MAARGVAKWQQRRGENSGKQRGSGGGSISIGGAENISKSWQNQAAWRKT